MRLFANEIAVFKYQYGKVYLSKENVRVIKIMIIKVKNKSCKLLLHNMLLNKVLLPLALGRLLLATRSTRHRWFDAK